MTVRRVWLEPGDTIEVVEARNLLELEARK